MKKKGDVTPAKKAVVKQFTKLMKEYPIVGAVNMENLPAQQLQGIRAKLRDKVELVMTKRKLMKIAIKQVKDKEGLDQLEQHLGGMPALLFTKENPFALFKTIKKNKSKAPAKAGQTAPNDIKVPAGPTPFAPGPVIGELGALGIKSKVDGGKIAILEDTVVCKEGDVISDKLAAMLTRLSILPMEVGLDVRAVWENGKIMPKKLLDIDEDEYIAKITQAAKWAFNLSMEAAIPTADNTELLVQKAFRETKAVTLEAGYPANGLTDELLTKAERQMLSVKDKGNIPTAEKKAAPAKEEPKAEEKKEEPKPEEKKEEAKPEQPKTDDTVAKMVDQQKNFEDNKDKSADDLLKKS